MRHRSLILRCAAIAAAAWACVERPAAVVGDVELAGPPGSGEPNLETAEDGTVLLSWLEPSRDGGHALRVAAREGGGWSEPRTIAESDSFFVNWADFPSILALPDGRWVAHWLRKVPGSVYAYHVEVAVSSDRGATWSPPVVPHRDRSPTEHGFVSMVPWPGGGVGILWLDGRAMKGGEGAEEGSGDMSVRFTTLAADGSLGPETLLDDRACECCQTALVRTASGYVAAYRDRSPREIRDIAVARHVDGRWSEPVIVAEDRWQYPGCPVNGPALAGAGEAVAIAWYTEGSGAPRVFAAFSEDGGARFGPPIRVDDGEPLGRVDVALLAGGSAAVAWLEAARGSGEVRVRRVGRDGAVGRSRKVAGVSQARASGFPRLARLGADSLLFAWTDTGESGGVRVAAGRVPR